ncbi:peptide/nickel transport system permease protein [Austwickia chelonae]|uniref:Putative ABC transporter permease protein n=1 Tax=Austwickia chelonae NBRC 105200 TaxID=1184607 RepID=K6ULK0_9MICO|nr:ABC transporter permease [Austwickia chelonae]GAB77316.1 putative ABC transporter permease protein [Austwickia chelonae NBRC 105200]SEW07648.1 peptide/nickel transport system permease protein [Austwickia chelonae]
MALTLARRGLILLASLFVSSIVVFGFMQVLPGDPARVALGITASEDSVARLRQEYGLEEPLLTQYASWMAGLLTGDMGASYVTGEQIAPRLFDALAVTGWLVGAALLVAAAVAGPLGTVMAVRHRHLDGIALTALSQVGIAIPAFLAGMILVALVSVRWDLLPSSGWVAPAQDPLAFLEHLALPALSLGLIQSAVLSRYIRSAVLDVLREDYMRTARSKGFTPTRALIRHGLRNAGVPVVTVLGLQISAMLIGAVVVERVFVVHGLGSLLLEAVRLRDLIVVQDVVMLLVAVVLVISFLTDALHVLIDPRTRAPRR